MKNNFKIALIGANGFVGKYIAKELKLRGFEFSKISIRSKNIKLDDRILKPNELKIIDQSFHTIIDCSNPSNDIEKETSYICEAKNFISLFKKFKFKGNYILFSSI